MAKNDEKGDKMLPEVKKLIAFKAKFGWTTDRIGFKIGCSGQTIRNWLKGRTSPFGPLLKLLRDLMTSYEIYSLDEDLKKKLVDEFILKHPVNWERADCAMAYYSLELSLDVFLDELYQKGYEIKKKDLAY